MSGALFMRPYAGHRPHIIKQSDETRGPISPVPTTDDLELFTPLKPNTIYLYRFVLFFTGSLLGNGVVPALSQTADFAVGVYHHNGADIGGSVWSSGSAGDSSSVTYNTAHFNAGTALGADETGAKRMFGMVRTGASGGTFSIKWGGGNGGRTLRAGSFLYLQEVTGSGIVIKQTDETIQSDNTMSDDSELTVALDAGETYFIDCLFVGASGATPDLKHSWVYTGTITSVGLSESVAEMKTPADAGTSDGYGRTAHVGAGTVLTTPTVRTRVGSNTANTTGGDHIRGVVVTNTSGNLKLQWAQNTSTASDTTVFAGSYMLVAKGTEIADFFGTLAYKTSDTSRATDTTPTDDPTLQFATGANKKYIAECLAVLDANSTTPDAKFQIYDPQVSLTAGHNLRAQTQAIGTFSTTTDIGTDGRWFESSFLTTPTQATLATSTTANKSWMFASWSHQMSGSASTCAIQWSQNTSSGTATIMRTGSWILWEEIVQ